MINGLLMVVLFVTAVFLVLVILIQRGKGGGLAGALGGMGGQSAFGTKAGDLFTRITIGVAAFWIILCAIAVNRFGHTADLFGGSTTASESPAGESLEPRAPAADAAAPEAGDTQSAPASQDAGSSKPAGSPTEPKSDK